MIKNNKAFKKNLRRILISVRDSGCLPENLSQDDLHCVEWCISQCFLSGVITDRMVSGKIIAEATDAIRIEQPGYNFLNPPLDWKFITASVIAALSLLLNFIQFLASRTPPLP